MTTPIPLPVQRLREGATLPRQATPGDAGYDLHSAEETYVHRGSRRLISTGIAVAIPEGYAGIIKPRSGLASKHGIDVLGGVIDSGYRGEIGVILQSHNSVGSLKIDAGDRIAQLVIVPVATLDVIEVDTLPGGTVRGTGGFGSTGTADRSERGALQVTTGDAL